MADQRPTLYLSNWSSRRTPGCHGPGRKLTIMAAPRQWEHGDGSVARLTPSVQDLRDVKDRLLAFEDYRQIFTDLAEKHRSEGRLTPGVLVTTADGGKHVQDGDTLCCACSRDDAAAGRCHRAWAAPLLVAAGWRVVLDGAEVSGG